MDSDAVGVGGFCESGPVHIFPVAMGKRSFGSPMSCNSNESTVIGPSCRQEEKYSNFGWTGSCCRRLD